VSTGESAARHPEAARADWADRVGRPTGGLTAQDPAARPRLEPPAGVRAEPGRGQVTLHWDPLPGAAGYLVHCAATGDGPFTPVDFGGNDVLAVPHPPFTDTTGTPGQRRWYAVAGVADVAAVGPLSEPVAAAALAAAGSGPAAVTVRVAAGDETGPLHRPWRPMIGSEHLSLLLSQDRWPDAPGGRPIGAELTEALRLCHHELGVCAVRAHAILGDDLGVYRESGGRPVHDFSGVDRVYDHVLSLGLRPVVELSFMPHDLAADPSQRVFAYDAIISPPKDWDRWAELVRDLVAHLVDRYGLAEVREHWSFEVWNEANLEVFWSGTPEEYLRLYEVTARAVKSVDPGLTVGGPASAAVGWVEEFLGFADSAGVPVDFVSTHTYGSPPLDLRPVLARHGRAGIPIWWTEWGATPTHFNPVGDEVFAAAFLLTGMRSAAGRIEALSHWVASDHFEELGRPPSLFHGGFGLLTVGNLRKPRYWALALLERLGERELAAVVEGDGAGGLVQAWAARSAGGDRLGVLVWNGTLDQSKAAGEPLLDRRVTVRLTGLRGDAYRVRHLRVDAAHSNVWAAWAEISGAADGASAGRAGWPAEAQWDELRARNTLDELEPERTVRAAAGELELACDLPMPGISLFELRPS
jgi:xylan 1,4-beta-xylosidase